MTCALALVACSSSSSAAPFTLPAGYTPGGVVPTCLLHQTAKPTPAYMGGAHNDLGVELPFLAYYTAVGAKPFCDSKKATARRQGLGAALRHAQHVDGHPGGGRHVQGQHDPRLSSVLPPPA